MGKAIFTADLGGVANIQMRKNFEDRSGERFLENCIRSRVNRS